MPIHPRSLSWTTGVILVEKIPQQRAELEFLSQTFSTGSGLPERLPSEQGGVDVGAVVRADGDRLDAEVAVKAAQGRLPRPPTDPGHRQIGAVTTRRT